MVGSAITNDHVRDNTSGRINQLIDQETASNVRRYEGASKADVYARIEQLDREWDIERTLELNAATVAFCGVVLSATVSRKWLILPGIVTFFLAQHAIQGWCPPLSLFRRMKVRTRKEIDEEKYQLLELLK